MNSFYPTYYKVSSGSGTSGFQLVSFDNALISAGISNYNLVKVSSILPAKCILSNSITLKKGSILYTAYGSISSNNDGEIIASAVCIALPQNDMDIGIIMEYSNRCPQKEAQDVVIAMAEDSMDKHSIPIKDIICSSIGCTVKGPQYTTVISAVSLW